MNELKVFENVMFGNLRLIEVEGKIYAIANDVARALGYKEPHKAVTRHCKGGTFHPVLTSGGMQDVRVIPEGDIYRLIVKSQLPEAEQFESWVFDEVIPQIRQTGGYIPIDEEEDDEAFLARALVVAQRTLEKKSKELQKAKAVIKLQEPKVTAYDYLMDTEGLINIGEFSRHFGYGRNTFFKILRDLGIISKQNGKNLPKEGHYRDCFELRRSRPNEKGISYPVTMIKSNKADKLVRKLIKEGFIESGTI